MKFELNDVEIASLNKWKTKIEKKFGSIGAIEYRFVNTGIGIHITVKDKKNKKSKDITDYNSW